MRKILFISITVVLLIGIYAVPASALSFNAEAFLRDCRAVDAPFPPPNWDRYDLRDAAIEVLDEIDAGNYDRWPIDFCLKALGHTRFPEDIDRIISYEDKMIYSVLVSLRGFTHEKSVNFFIKYLENEKSPKRESAVRGLGSMDYKKFEKPEIWKNKAITAINKLKQKEKIGWLLEDIDEVLYDIEHQSTSTSE